MSQRTFFNTRFVGALLVCSTLPLFLVGCGNPNCGTMTSSSDCPDKDGGNVLPSCTDGKKNGTETGVDCGGSCMACVATGCMTGADCSSKVCKLDQNCMNPNGCLGTCADASCTDTVQNGNETGVDCGGSCMACPSICHPTKDDPLCNSQPGSTCECDLSVAPMNDVCRGDMMPSCLALNKCETGKSNDCWAVNIPKDGKSHPMACACFDKLYDDLWTDGQGGEQGVHANWNNGWAWVDMGNATTLLTCSDRDVFGLLGAQGSTSCVGKFSQDCNTLMISCDGQSGSYNWIRHRQ